MTCWLCGRMISDPPHIVGRWHTTSPRVAHRHCLRTLGELDVELEPLADDGGELGPDPRTVPGRHG